jgi:hypothetical protein
MLQHLEAEPQEDLVRGQEELLEVDHLEAKEELVGLTQHGLQRHQLEEIVVMQLAVVVEVIE